MILFRVHDRLRPGFDGVQRFELGGPGRREMEFTESERKHDSGGSSSARWEGSRGGLPLRSGLRAWARAEATLL